MNIKVESPTQSSLPSDSPLVCMKDQTLPTRRNSSPQVSQVKPLGTFHTIYHSHRPPFKKHRSNFSRPRSPKVEHKISPSRSRAQEAGPSSIETVHKEFESKIGFDPIPPLLFAKAETKIVDELKAQRDRLLRVIEQKCEADCLAELKPCPVMLRLGIMHGYAKSWVK